MNPFETARLKAHDVRRILLSHGLSANSKGPVLVAVALKQWHFALRRVPPRHALLGDADAKIKIKQRWIIVRNDLSPELEAFLIAHEIGHFFLHQEGHSSVAVSTAVLQPEADGSAAVRYVEAYGPRERQELQANVFARELLLPRSFAYDLFMKAGRPASGIASDLELTPEVVRLQLLDALLLPQLPATPAAALPLKPTDAQQAAVHSPHRHTLVEAGPGTGKTTTLLLRLRHLLSSGADPTGVVILTFSNKAARELLERLKISGIPGSERVWVGTFHSFGLEFLRKFGQLCGLKPQVQVLDKVATFGLIENLLPQLALHHFDPLADPIGWLPEVLDTIARCKDDLIDSAAYRVAVEQRPTQDIDAETQARRLDAANVYDIYERELADRHAVDLNDLLIKTITLLEGNDASVATYLLSLKHILVDEYQDVNRASARLVKSLSRHAETVWAVGDAHQAVYAFMGASRRNIRDFADDYPGAERIPLAANHRSTQEIADTFYQLSQRGPEQPAAHHLKAEKGRSGLKPQLVLCEDEMDQMNALTDRINALRSTVPFGAQAVLVFSNEAATSIAQALEQRRIPVLFLGSLFERPEIKDLLCLLHLSVDHAGAGLGRDWVTANLAIPHEDVKALLAQKGGDGGATTPWWEKERTNLSEQGQRALRQIDELTAALRGLVSPWDALCELLLENGRLLRPLVTQDTQSAINTRLAIWQFVHSCRTPDALAPYATVRNLFGRIARRMRLNADRNLRQVPPEAEGLDAVRILTVHTSKGLEFDAVHLLEAERSVYEPKFRRQWPLIPQELMAQAAGIEENLVSRTERHNLLYVALSRARAHLTIFKQRDVDMPTALEGLCEPANPTRSEISPIRPPPPRRPNEKVTEISLDMLAGSKNGCPRRAEFVRRIGRVSSGALPAYRRLDIAQSRVLRTLTSSAEARSEEAIALSIQAELQAVELWDNKQRPAMMQRLERISHTAAALYNQGGSVDQPVALHIAPLQVIVVPNQVFRSSAGTVLRLFRARDSQQLSWDKQTLGALLKTHEQATGSSLRAEFVVLNEDGRVEATTKVREKTVQDYEAVAAAIAAGTFPANPSPRTCPACPYLMLCDQGRV